MENHNKKLLLQALRDTMHKANKEEKKYGEGRIVGEKKMDGERKGR